MYLVSLISILISIFDQRENILVGMHLPCGFQCGQKPTFSCIRIEVHQAMIHRHHKTENSCIRLLFNSSTWTIFFAFGSTPGTHYSNAQICWFAKTQLVAKFDIFLSNLNTSFRCYLKWYCVTRRSLRWRRFNDFGQNFSYWIFWKPTCSRGSTVYQKNKINIFEAVKCVRKSAFQLRGRWNVYYECAWHINDNI